MMICLHDVQIKVIQDGIFFGDGWRMMDIYGFVRCVITSVVSLPSSSGK